MEEQKHIALLRNKQTNHIFQYLGEMRFTNLTRATSGVLNPDDARKVFVIPGALNEMVVKNPIVYDLIVNLRLKMTENQ